MSFTKNITVISADFQTIRPDDSPGIKRLRRLAARDTTKLEILP